jgi:hypothetical protein
LDAVELQLHLGRKRSIDTGESVRQATVAARRHFDLLLLLLLLLILILALPLPLPLGLLVVDGVLVAVLVLVPFWLCYDAFVASGQCLPLLQKSLRRFHLPQGPAVLLPRALLLPLQQTHPQHHPKTHFLLHRNSLPSDPRRQGIVLRQHLRCQIR